MMIVKQYNNNYMIFLLKFFKQFFKSINIYIVIIVYISFSYCSLHNNNELFAFKMNISYDDENIRPFNAGHDIDGQNLFICRTHKFGQIIPGKYSHTIGKCSIAYDKKEWQFNQFELLIEDVHTKYEWIKLKKPVIELPENVLYAGRQIEQFVSTNQLFKQNYEFLNVLTPKKYNQSKRKRQRRHRRDIFDKHQQWSRNWRGRVTKIPNYQIRRVRQNEFIEIPLTMGNCSINDNHHRDEKITKQQKLCLKNEKRKLNYFIAKCSLRTGDRISEQIGKIWWKNSNQEWIASFPFGGHEIYCLDYSVLTLKN